MLITTIVARNYLAQARVLARSFLDHHPDGRVVALVIDAPGEGLRDDEPFDVLTPEAVFASGDRRELRHMATIYNVMELATALKPFLLRHLVTVDGAASVTYLDPDIEVFGPLDDVAVAAEHSGVVLTPHRLAPVPADGRQPDEQVFAQAGAYNLGFVAVSAAASPFLDWWADRCRRDCIHAVPEGLFVDQRWVDVGAAYFAPHVLRDPGYNVAYWNLDERPVAGGPADATAGGSPLRFLHYSGYDPDAPHALTRYHSGQPRVLLSERPALRRLCDRYAERLVAEGWHDCRKLDYGRAQAANGMVIDGLMRRVYRQELLRRERTREHDIGAADELPDVYDPAQVEAFVEMLRSPFPGSPAPRIPRYLHALHHSRPDIQAACPDLTGLAGNHYLAWIREAGQRDLGLPPEVIPAADDIEAGPEDATTASRPASGVRLVGYLQAELGVGEMGRATAAGLRAAGENVSTITEAVTWSRQRHDGRDGNDGRVGDGRSPAPAREADVNVVCVNADRFPAVMDRLGRRFSHGRHTIGVWAWEVEQFPSVFAASAKHVDEVWTPSAHAQRAIAAAVDVPVHTVPPPVIEAPTSGRSRRDLGLPDGFVFLFCFDFFSVAERKNPVGVVEAFRRAFGPGEGPQLVIKSINGGVALVELERLRLAAGGRPDIHVVDRYHDAADQRALIAACDAYVSLHRAEGLGYTMAEAMLAGRPVIATGYSGNLEFMDEHNSFLVGHDMVAIPEGCDPYPAGSVWAEPDLDEAAALMRLVVEDRARAGAVAARGRHDIRRFHSPEARAPLMAARLAAARSAREDVAASQVIAATSPVALVRRAARAGVHGLARRGLLPPDLGHDHDDG
ncbi:MAG: glycosyltransferase [Acidimicrobiales bacterium]|nr:glycosyltransferase [Acidimicrobiales bacterium]